MIFFQQWADKVEHIKLFVKITNVHYHRSIVFAISIKYFSDWQYRFVKIEHINFVRMTEVLSVHCMMMDERRLPGNGWSATIPIIIPDSYHGPYLSTKCRFRSLPNVHRPSTLSSHADTESKLYRRRRGDRIHDFLAAADRVMIRNGARIMLWSKKQIWLSITKRLQNSCSECNVPITNNQRCIRTRAGKGWERTYGNRKP